MSRSARLVCSLVAAIALAGCDAVAPSAVAPSAVAPVVLDVRGQGAVDVFYRIDRVPPGETFTARIDGALGAVTLRYHGGSGVVDALPPTPPTAVTVAYVADGVVLGTAAAKAVDGAFSAGRTDDDPTSVHYRPRPDGSIVVEYDYERSSEPVPFTAADGRTFGVTHVRFVMEGVAVGAPQSVTFEAPSAVTVL